MNKKIILMAFSVLTSVTSVGLAAPGLCDTLVKGNWSGTVTNASASCSAISSQYAVGTTVTANFNPYEVDLPGMPACNINFNGDSSSSLSFGTYSPVLGGSVVYPCDGCVAQLVVGTTKGQVNAPGNFYTDNVSKSSILTTMTVYTDKADPTDCKVTFKITK